MHSCLHAQPSLAKGKTLKYQHLDKNSKIWFATLVARQKSLKWKNFNTLASKLRESFEVKDGKSDIFQSFYPVDFFVFDF